MCPRTSAHNRGARVALNAGSRSTIGVVLPSRRGSPFDGRPLSGSSSDRIPVARCERERLPVGRRRFRRPHRLSIEVYFERMLNVIA